MVKFQTLLKQTVTLVESRVRDNRSEDPMKDLAFLSEHYRSKHEWDKAGAATRHMLAVAEGNTSSIFEITPVDIELQLSKKNFRRRFRSRILVAVILVSVVVGGTHFATVQLENNRKFVLDVKAQMFPLDLKNFVERAEYFHARNKLKEAVDECNRALALDPKYSGALQKKLVY